MTFEIVYIQKGVRSTVIMDGKIAELRKKMRSEKKTVISMKQKYISPYRKIKPDDKIVFFDSVGDQLKSATPLSKALESTLSSLDKTAPMRPVVQNITSAVKEGKPLSEALKTYESIFGRTPVAMIYASENTGKLGETLLTVAEYIQTMDELMSKMWKSLAYPLTTMGVGIVSMTVYSKFVLPKILNSGMMKQGSAAAKDKTVENAVSALQIIGMATPYVVSLIIAFVVGMFLYYKSNQEEAEKIMVKIPGVRELVFYRAYFVAFSSLSKLTSVGVSMDAAMRIVAESAQMIMVKREFEAAYSALKQEGTSFAKKLKTLTPVERNMLENAMSNDSFSRKFEKIASRFYKLYLKKVSAIGPKVYTGTMVLGFIVVLLMITAIMLPNLKMLSSVSGQH
jgi:type II secretory pathway component PulF